MNYFEFCIKQEKAIFQQGETRRITLEELKREGEIFELNNQIGNTSVHVYCYKAQEKDKAIRTKESIRFSPRAYLCSSCGIVSGIPEIKAVPEEKPTTLECLCALCREKL